MMIIIIIPNSPCSQSHLTPPFCSSPEILFPQDCWHPEDRSGAGVMLGVRDITWDGRRWDGMRWDGVGCGFLSGQRVQIMVCQRFFHVTLSLPFNLLSSSIFQQLKGVVLFSLAVWIVSCLKQRQIHLPACLLLAGASALIFLLMRE